MEEFYQLSDEFSLNQCSIEEFVKNWAVYSSFSAWDDYKTRKDIVMGFHEDKVESYYMIKKHKIRIGGVMLKPNGLGHLFFKPPFVDYYSAIRLLAKLLRDISDKKKATYVFCITPEFVDDFLRCGFYPNETRRRMIRATEKFDVKWDDNLIVKTPETQDAEEIVCVYLSAYSGSREEWLRSQEGLGKEVKNSEKILKKYTEQLEYKEDTEYPFISEASTAIFSEIDGKQILIGACLVAIWHENEPIVYEIFVAPEYQGKGLGTKMLKHALTKLANKYDYLQLFVIKGNTSESVYHNLGFKSLEEVSMLIIPAKKHINNSNHVTSSEQR